MTPNSPKCALDAINVVLLPVPLGDILLADRDTLPGYPHDGNVVNIVLIKRDGQLGEMTSRPLLQPPLLDDVLGRVQLDVLALHVSVEKLKLPSRLGALEDLGGCSGESRDASGVGESLVQLVGRSAELGRVG